MNFDNDPEIQKLKQRVLELLEELQSAQIKLEAAKLDRCSVKLGDIVRGTSGRNAYKLFKVVDINPDYGIGWVKGAPQKKDGSFSTSVRNTLFDSWEKVEE